MLGFWDRETLEWTGSFCPLAGWTGLYGATLLGELKTTMLPLLFPRLIDFTVEALDVPWVAIGSIGRPGYFAAPWRMFDKTGSGVLSIKLAGFGTRFMVHGTWLGAAASFVVYNNFTVLFPTLGCQVFRY